MRRRIEALADRVEELVSEDAHDAFVVACTPEAVGLVATAIDLVEQRGSRDVALLLVAPFEDPERSLAALRDEVVAFAQGAKLALADDSDGFVAAASLARAVLAHGDVRVSVWLVPPSVADEAAYVAHALALVAAARRASPRLRVGVRDLPSHAVTEALRRAGIPSLEIHADLSPEAVAEDLARAAHDPDESPDARASAAMSLGLIEALRGRGAAAEALLASAADHFTDRGLHDQRALAFALSGMALAIGGDARAARDRIRRGVQIALARQARVGIVVGSACAAELATRDADLAEAEAYYRLALGVACGMRAVPWVVDLSVRLGETLLARGRPAEAHETWGQALALAQRAGHPELLALPARPLRALYERSGLPDGVAAMSRLLDALGADEPAHAEPHAHHHGACG